MKLCLRNGCGDPIHLEEISSCKLGKLSEKVCGEDRLWLEELLGKHNFGDGG